jgi:hypothetical protein
VLRHPPKFKILFFLRENFEKLLLGVDFHASIKGEEGRKKMTKKKAFWFI